MKKLLCLGLLVLGAVTGFAQPPPRDMTIDLPQGVTVVRSYTATVHSVVLQIVNPKDLVSLARPYVADDGTFGREIIPGMVRLNTSGDTMLVRDLAQSLQDGLKVTSAELKAAATDLSLEWGTANGADELKIQMYAFVKKIGGLFMSGPTLDAWVTSVYTNLLTQLQPILAP